MIEGYLVRNFTWSKASIKEILFGGRLKCINYETLETDEQAHTQIK